MKVVLERFGFGLDSTLGRLYVDGEPVAYTIEDARRKAKVPGKTAIPCGIYKLRLRTEGGLHIKYTRRFPAFHMGMLWLQDVPDFEWVMLHCGNDATDSEGCPLIVSFAALSPDGEFIGHESAKAYEKTYRRIVEQWDGDVWLTIREREAA